MDIYRRIWDARYEKQRQSGKKLEGELWLVDWLRLVRRSNSMRALDLGCGSGSNVKLLLERGFEVCAMDFSEHALSLCRRTAPGAHGVVADIRDGLPFTGSVFDLVVADLSLHYFTLAVTASAVRDIADRLVNGGLFAGRFNSINDLNYGAGAGIAIPEDSKMFLVDGIRKRFFTRTCFNTLVGPQWRLVSLMEKSTFRYGPQKIFWELICTRRG